MIIFNININHWTCEHVVIMWFQLSVYLVSELISILVSYIVYKTYFWANFGLKRALAGACPSSWATQKRVFVVSRHDGNTKIGGFAQRNDFEPKTALLGPKRATLGHRGRETARRAAKRPPTGKPKVSRVTSGYGGLMIPLSRVRLTPKNGGYMGVA